MTSVLGRVSFLFCLFALAPDVQRVFFVFFCLPVVWCMHALMASVLLSALSFFFSCPHVIFAGNLQRGEQGRGEQGAAPWGVRGRLRGPHLG